MKINFKENHLSISAFDSVIINDFSIITGLNGSGKTHLLTAIKKGYVEIEKINSSEIMYYNYSSFTVYTENLTSWKGSDWRSEAQLTIQKVQQIRNQAIAEVINNSKNDALLFAACRVFTGIRERVIGIETDYEILSKTEIHKGNLNQYRNDISPEFFNFILHILNYNAAYNLKELTPWKVKEKIDLAFLKIEEQIKKTDEDFFNYLENNLKNVDIFSINQAHFEAPNFILADIANEEKDYQFLLNQNFLNEIKARHNKNIKYLTHESFIDTYGASPIEQINQVLKQYDCNSYFLKTNDLDIKIGQDKNQFQIQITLVQEENNIETTFEELSSGEKTLIALTLLIYKSRKNKILPRVLLLDEIDASLHPSMIKRLLNTLIEIFIKKHKMKIIMATHSPTTIAFSEEDSIFIINKGNVLQKIEKQSKQKALEILTEGFATLNEEESDMGIMYNLSKSNLPILFTEGITDKIIIEETWKKLFNETPMPYCVQDCFDASFLANLYKRGFGPDGVFNSYPNRVFIALFDFDQMGYNSWNSLKKNLGLCVVESDPYKGLTICDATKKIFAMLLPVPKNEIIEKQVIGLNGDTFENQSLCNIEHLFYGVSMLNGHFREKECPGQNKIVEFFGDKKAFANKIKQLPKEGCASFNALFSQIGNILNGSIIKK